MNRFPIIMITFAVVVLSAGAAAATQIEGTIQGFNCVTNGKTCPVGKEDPVIATERIFVVLTKDGKYYFVPNLDRAIMARHIARPVRVSGKIDPNYKSINAESLEVMTGETWKVTWTTEMERDVARSFGVSGF